MKLTKQTVYLPVKVEDEKIPEYTNVIVSCEGNTHFNQIKHYASHFKEDFEMVTHWLKPQEGYFFTPEQLNQLLSDVVKDALNTAAENVKILEEELGSDEYSETPLAIFESTEFTADKGYEECYFYRYKPSKKSITNTFEETFNKFKV